MKQGSNLRINLNFQKLNCTWMALLRLNPKPKIETLKCLSSAIFSAKVQSTTSDEKYLKFIS